MATSCRPFPDWPTLACTAGVNTLVALLFPLMSILYGGRFSMANFTGDFVTAWTFANCIGLPAALMPWEKVLRKPRSALAMWTLNVVILVALAATGTVAAGAIFIAIGWVQPSGFGEFYRHNIAITILITLLVGCGFIAYETQRSKLVQAAVDRERALKLATEARLSSLESRLHPHFLFNTLNSISSLIPDDPKRAERLVEQMAALLRFSLDSAQRGMVPLERELKIVNDYLEIEKARLGDRLEFGIRVKGDPEGVGVPPLAIQTLVENSIKHAIAPDRAGGKVEVNVAVSAAGVEIAVYDSGPGFSLERTPAGHGLDNLQNRLTTLYGGGARLRATRNGTAAVNVLLPLVRVVGAPD